LYPFTWATAGACGGRKERIEGGERSWEKEGEKEGEGERRRRREKEGGYTNIIQINTLKDTRGEWR
jgi:hypothetical protein